ncbi:MAG: glycoside hydrolase family 127 protein [Candidatus Bathyarchaeia archaeon]
MTSKCSTKSILGEIELYFEKLSKFDRKAEPVSVAIPFPKGLLVDPEQLQILDGEKFLFSQKYITAKWDDGSIKWLLVHFQVDLPGNKSKKIRAIIYKEGVAVSPPEICVQVIKSTEGVTINTGPLILNVQKKGFDIFREVIFEGRRLWGPGFTSGFYIISDDGSYYTTSRDEAEITVDEEGPLRAVVSAHGKHRDESGRTLFDYRTRIIAYAGKPYVEVEYQFINRERVPEVIIKEIGLHISKEPKGTPRLAIGEGYYQTRIEHSTKALEKLINAETILWQSNEHDEECFYGDFWADFMDEESGLAVSIYQAHQNFPKALKVNSHGITVLLYPSVEKPIGILQGVAKTHKIMLNFHKPDADLEEISSRSLQFQLPDQPIIPESWYEKSNVWQERVFVKKICNRLELLLIDMIDNRSKGLGMLSFGDGPEAGYTEQGRGRGDIVWCNNEYDPPHALFIQYARTGERRFRALAEAAAQHWIDVDFCHFSENPLREGGQIIHSARHATGGVTISHEWVQGLLDFYHFTGKREALEKALAIGENIIRHLRSPAYQRLGYFQARDTGWALLSLLSLYQETYEKRYLDIAKEIVESFLQWKEKFGTFLAPYTSHTQVRVPFMITIALNSLMRYYWITGDERVKKVIVEVLDDLIENAIMRGGILYYKELPSLQHRSPTPHFLESLAYAYELTGDQKYLRIGLRQLEYMLDRGFRRGGLPGRKEVRGDSIVKGYGLPGPGFAFASSLISILTFYKAASENNMLDHLDYKY